MAVTVKYEEFFHLPLKPSKASECLAKCKLCPDGTQPYKYTLTTKGNLLKHLQSSHEQLLKEHRKEREKDRMQRQLHASRTQLKLTSTSAGNFAKQDMIVTSIVKNLVGAGGIALQVVERDWFRQFLCDVEPRFKPVSRVAVKRKLSTLYDEDRQQLKQKLSNISFKPSVTLDFWTGRGGRSFMGCTIHFINDNKLVQHMLFFREVPPPHTAEIVRNRFEDELDHRNIKCFQVVTDNAANMKCAFLMSDVSDETDEEELSNDEESDSDESHSLHYWTPQQLKFEGWLGCACHTLQLVIHDGYQELTSYRRVQAAFSKAKAICTLSRKSSHFSYALNAKIPVPNETRWNSYLRLHEHILKHFDDINDALATENVNRLELVLSSTDKENLTRVVEIMQYFAEGTDILQASNEPTSGQVIPIIDSLENALENAERSNTAINALCERLHNGLQQRFSYLLNSSIHQAATALDPRIKLTFADKFSPSKYFIFSSTTVKEKIKSLLQLQSSVPTYSQLPELVSNTSDDNIDSSVPKKKRLLDYSSSTCSFQGSQAIHLSPIDVELEAFFGSPCVKVKPVQFWSQRNESPLKKLALELFSIPSSSAPVERLFSKAGIILNQRRTRLSSSSIEELLAFK